MNQCPKLQIPTGPNPDTQLTDRLTLECRRAGGPAHSAHQYVMADSRGPMAQFWTLEEVERDPSRAGDAGELVALLTPSMPVASWVTILRLLDESVPGALVRHVPGAIEVRRP